MAAPAVRATADPSVRAIENPLIAIFDLADQVNDRVPRLRRTLRIAMGVTTVVVLLVLIIGLVILFSPGAPLAVAFFLGIALLLYLIYQMYQANDFFDYFEARHRTIRIVRDADPVVYVPKGRDAVDRFVQHLRQTSPRFAQLGQQFPHYIHTPAIMTGHSGVSYSFDCYAFIPCSTSWEMFGHGDGGWALFVKVFPHPPGLRELRALELAVTDVSAKTHIVPSRVVALVETVGEMVIPEEAYQHLVEGPLRVKMHGRHCAVNRQVVTTDVDGTYDFIPMVTTSPEQLP